MNHIWGPVLLKVKIASIYLNIMQNILIAQFLAGE